MSEHPDRAPLALSELIAADRATRIAAASARRWLDLYRTASETLSEPSLDILLREALEAIARTLKADAVSLLLADDDSSELIARGAFGLDREIDRSLSIPSGAGLAGPILATGEPRIIDDLTEIHTMSDVLKTSGQHSFVGVPLSSGDRILGVLHATSRQVSMFNEGDAELLMRFAEPLAAAIERVRLFDNERIAKHLAERATERVRRLQRITASLVAAVTINEICQVIIDEAALGSGDDGERAIWMLRDSSLVLIAGAGASRDYSEIPIDTALPATEIRKRGEALFVETRAELANRWPMLAGGQIASFAAMPLIVEGQCLGVMALGFYEERHFAQDDREYLTATAEQAAVALARAETREALQAAINIAEERREQLDFLAEASERLSKSLDLNVTLQVIAELGVPRLTDRCALFLIEGRDITQRVLAPVLNDDEAALFEESESTRSSQSAVAEVIRTGQARYIREVEDSMLVADSVSQERLDLLRRVGFGGLLITPMRARGKTLGALAFVNRKERPINSADRALAEELSARAAMAIDNAMLYSAESHIAHRLAESLLPNHLPTIEGLDIAVRYQFGTSGVEVGGDFYDVFDVGPDEFIVLIGDVQGKGVEAAALTGLARHTVRASARYNTSPAALLRDLNSAIIRNINENVTNHARPWRETRLCTAAIIRLVRRTDSWSATISCAGHPIPLMRRPNGNVAGLCKSALLLGVRDDPEYTDSDISLEIGSTIVLFTDGVSERRNGDDIFGGEGIADVLSKIEGSAKRVANDIVDVAVLHKPFQNDDLVVLAIRMVRSAEA